MGSRAVTERACGSGVRPTAAQLIFDLLLTRANRCATVPELRRDLIPMGLCRQTIRSALIQTPEAFVLGEDASWTLLDGATRPVNGWKVRLSRPVTALYSAADSPAVQFSSLNAWMAMPLVAPMRGTR